MLLPLATIVTWYGPDESLFRALNLAGTNVVLDVIMVFLTSLALPYVLPFLALPLWWKGHRELAFDLLVLLVLVIAVTQGLKYAIDRPRPCDVLADAHLLSPGACLAELDPAFPSGHTSRIFAVAMLLAMHFKAPVKASAFGLAVLVGLSRIYLGLHWPTDVVGGALVGVLLALGIEFLSRKTAYYPRIRGRVVEAVARVVRRKPAP